MAQTKISINLDAFPAYMRSMSDACTSFCESQRKIDNSYNNVQSTWVDKNCVHTGRVLMQTATGIKGFYAKLTSELDHTKEYYKKCADIIDIPVVYLPPIDTFKIVLREPTNMSNNTIITNIEVLRDFKRSLDQYIQMIGNNVNDLNSSYRSVGASWDDDHYREFGDALSGFSKMMQGQVDQLMIISRYLEARIAKYEAANRV